MNTTDQLKTGLSDAHAVEEQALVQLRSAPGAAGEPDLAAALHEHLHETERHEELVRERLEAVGDSPSTIKDLLAAAGGHGFVLFARAQPDTPGKLAAHAYAYEHLELGIYELLARVAREDGDAETVQMAQSIGAEERRMGERLESLFARTAEASLQALRSEDADGPLDSYLGDAHALEQQSIALLERACEVTEPGPLRDAYAAHLQESRRHRELVADLLEDRGAPASRVKDTAMKAGGMGWATFFRAQSATPAKVAAFAFAFEHLEIGGYEQLQVVAERSGDRAAADLARMLASEERRAAAGIAAHWDEAVGQALRA